MSNCGQACPYNTLDGCKVKEHNAICPLTNMATPITEYRMTNADRIRAMSDEELAYMFSDFCKGMENCNHCICYDNCPGESAVCWMKWLQQPAKEGE